MSGDPIRVLVVDDSLTVRKYIVEVLSAAANVEVVAEASDGKEAIELCQRLRPDVLTMDMMLPIMTGVAATEYIMAYCPTPILIVSASTNRGELFRTYDALAAGAVDVLDKPIGGETDAGWEVKLIAAVRMVARIRVITHLRGRAPRSGQSLPPLSTDGDGPQRRVVALGASTGGPSALRTVLTSLPDGFSLPILLVLHISEPFGQAMADWLDGQLALEVRYARDREPLPLGRGCVLMAPPGQQLELVGDRLRLTDAPERHSCRPSVDVLFESVAESMGRHAIAALLTGMGRDGAEGLLAIKQLGGLTYAQDEATSVVFGMPGEAAKLGAATHVLGLPHIGPAIGRAAQRDGRRTP
jgi:two-component system chemotaxis response regulator CheB